jgi:hypothetical protein
MNRPLAPKFIKKYDEYLLKNKPELYSTRFHWVLYYGLMSIILLSSIFAIIPNDARSDTPIFIHTCFVVIIAIIGLIVWLIFLLRFNVFKRFGNITAIGRLSVFWLYVISCIIIVASCFVPSVVETLRANNSFKEKELINDLNTINTSICRLEYDSLSKVWNRNVYQAFDYYLSKKDTVITLDENEKLRKYYDSDITVPAVDEPYANDVVESYKLDDEEYRINSTTYYELLKKVIQSDSSIKINDSTYALYTCPAYKKVNIKSYGSIIDDSCFNDTDLFHHIFQFPKPIDKTKEWNTLKPLLEKYSYEYGSLHQYKPPVFKDYDTIYHDRLQKRYTIYTVENNFRNIVERKYRYSSRDEIEFFVRFILYPSLIFSLLLFVFRHSTIKTFFLSILSGFLLLIIAAIITAFSSFGNNEVTVFAMIFFYLLLFLVISITTFQSKNRTAWQGIGINLFTWMSYFLPLILVSFYYSLVKVPYYLDQKAREVFSEQRMVNYLIAEAVCPVLFSILLVTFIYKLYRKWYALPQE